MVGAQKPYSVSEVTAILADQLRSLPRVVVEGEVSNCRAASVSGHLYFTLGDEKAKLNAAFFAFNQQAQQRLGEALPTVTNGCKVRAVGRIAVYAPHGSYHLRVEHLERCDGVGELLQRFDALKRKLFAEGLCDLKRKRKLPKVPRRIGIVTAPTGAAIHDILSILGRRYPNLHIVIAPCRVQGEEAPAEIAQAIRLLNQHFGPTSKEPLDALIVGRGGGSLEDLWAFNEEVVARAVAASEIPVISAVGHEPDNAITDFVADIRAATPSAAAELLCGEKESFEKALKISKERLLNALREMYRRARQTLNAYKVSPLFRDPEYILATHAQRIDGLCVRLNHVFSTRYAEAKACLETQSLELQRACAEALPETVQRIQKQGVRLQLALERRLSAESASVQARAAKLSACDPYAVLRRGYALVTEQGGASVSKSQQVVIGQVVNVQLAQGRFSACVESVSPD